MNFLVSVIIINYKTFDLLKNCLQSLILNHNKINYEIIIVDNDSKDNAIDNLKSIYPDVRIVQLSENIGFSRANNIAAKQAVGDYFLFVNSDVLFIENSIDKMLNYYINGKNIGILGPKLLNLDYSFQLSAGKLPNFFVEIKDKIIYSICKKSKYFNSLVERIFFDKISEVEWVTGACMLIDRDTYYKVHGFDENFFLYFEDKDLCARVRALNKKIIYYPETSVIHLLGGSSRQKHTKEVKDIYRNSQIYYYKKHLNCFHNKLLKLYLSKNA